jgi:dephospho-CoA kinase
MKSKLKEKYRLLDKSQRLYGLSLPVIAITGGIATGKSTLTNIIRERGFQVIDADSLVKKIYQTEEANYFIKQHIKEAWTDGKINFKKLRDYFFSNSEYKKLLEEFIYSKLPFFFLEEAKKNFDQDFYFYDVPLLFEKKLEDKIDISILVYANEDIQTQRLMKRDNCSLKDAKTILSHQINIESKKDKAHFIINNEGSLEKLSRDVSLLIQELIEY